MSRKLDKSHGVAEKSSNGETPKKQSVIPTPSNPHSSLQFRIFVGSYEHNLLCLSAMIDSTGSKDAVFQPIFHFEAHSRSIKSIDLAKRYLVTGSNDEHIRIYDLQKRKELGNLLGHQGTITTLRFSTENSSVVNAEKSGKWLLSGSEDGKIIIWRTKDWEMFATLKGHTGKINDLAIHPSGRVAISVSSDQTIRLWNLMTAKKAAVLKIKGKDHLGQVGEYVRWSNNGDYFVVGLLNQIFIYNTSGAKIVKKIKFNATVMCIEIVNFDGKQWLVVGLGQGALQLYDFDEVIATIDEEVKESDVWDSKAQVLPPTFELRGHTNRIKGLTFFNHTCTNNIPHLISVSSDGKIVVWNLDTRDQVAVYDTGERLNCVAVSPESIEKIDTMKKRYNSLQEMNPDYDGSVSESEYETDGEEVKRVMTGKKKGSKNKKRKVTVTLEN